MPNNFDGMSDKEIDNRLVSEMEDHEDDSTCLDVINESVSDRAGIIQVALDKANEKMVIDFDPQETNSAEIFQIAHDLAPTLHKHWRTCTMRLERRGGPDCESCTLALESRVGKLEGVQRATASYIGGVLSVTYDDAVVSPDELMDRVQQLGIPVEPSAVERTEDMAAAEERLPPLGRFSRRLKGRKIEAALVLITLIGIISGIVFENIAGMPSLAAASYLLAYVSGGYFGLRAGLASLRLGRIDVDVLMVLAALGAVYIGAALEGALLLFLFSLSNLLQNIALDRTHDAIESLITLRPTEAMIRRGGRLVALPIEEARRGDHFVVRPGERVALDGLVLEGSSTVDQSPITGESMPVSKKIGDEVLSGTINLHGSLEVGVTRLVKESTITKMIQLVEEAQSEKAQTQRVIDKIEQYYATGVVVVTILAVLLPVLVFGETIGPAFFRAISLMVAASPCALVISTPATVLSAIGNGARNGVLFKGGVYVEQLAAVKVVAFDKTGTLTTGKPVVTDIIPFNDRGDQPQANSEETLNSEQLLSLAAALESRSEHPLARAIVARARDLDLPTEEATFFKAESGLGVRARVNGCGYLIGNRRLLESYSGGDLHSSSAVIEDLNREGKTSILVAREQENGLQTLGVIGISDVLRPKAKNAIGSLRKAGVERIVMLTGDNEFVAAPIARAAGVDEYYANLLPQDKLELLHQLNRKFGPVAMVGDGVNDAPALAAANVGIAMGAAGTDVAMETADVVLMADELEKIPYVFELSRKTRRTLVQNLVFAFVVIVVLVAAVFRIGLPLPLAVIGHEGSTVLVSLNGLRLLKYHPVVS